MRFWSFGAGLGPTDAQAIQVTALEAFADHLLDDNGTFKRDRDLVKGKQLNPGQTEWVRRLKIETADVQGLLLLLKDDRVPARWLGLKKVERSRLPTDTILDAVRSIALNDPYVRIARHTVEYREVIQLRDQVQDRN